MRPTHAQLGFGGRPRAHEHLHRRLPTVASRDYARAKLGYLSSRCIREVVLAIRRFRGGDGGKHPADEVRTGPSLLALRKGKDRMRK